MLVTMNESVASLCYGVHFLVCVIFLTYNTFCSLVLLLYYGIILQRLIMVRSR